MRKKKDEKESRGVRKLGQQLGNAITAVFSSGGSVEIKVKKKNDNPYNEEDPPIPDWLK
jgi:hypothetical protein